MLCATKGEVLGLTELRIGERCSKNKPDVTFVNYS